MDTEECTDTPTGAEAGAAAGVEAGASEEDSAGDSDGEVTPTYAHVSHGCPDGGGRECTAP